MTANDHITKLKEWIAEAQVYSKFIAACIGGILTFGSTLLPNEFAVYLTGALVVLTAFSVWRVENKPAAVEGAPVE